MKTQGKIWLFFDAETKVQSRPLNLVQAQAYLLKLKAEDLRKNFIWTPGWSDWECLKDFLETHQEYFVQMEPPPPSPGDVVTETPSHFGPSEDTVTTTSHSRIDIDSPYTHVVPENTSIKHIPSQNGGCDYHLQDFNGDELDLNKIKKLNATKKKKSSREKIAASEETQKSSDRKSTRHDFKIEVILVSKVRSFRTYSQNISLSGTKLADEIPKEFLNSSFDLIIVNPFEQDIQRARLLFKAKIIGDLKDPRRLMFIEQDAAMTLRLKSLLKDYISHQQKIRGKVG
ncbi:MAG TPA: PilZ domain-containing protein [Bdellovibrio sp.]|nr:PilZ domain-containing protein [Bdellovibrio sp.]